MNTTARQEYHLRHLPTRSVTLFPTRAQIVRDLKDVVLKPGENEITIYGLTPTVDEQSIKVEGTGSAAVISNIATELRRNRDIFQEIYPDSDDDDDDEKTASETEDDKEDAWANTGDSLELKAVNNKIQDCKDEQAEVDETINSADRRLRILDDYGTRMLDTDKSIDIEQGVESYRTERIKVFKDHQAATIKKRQLIERTNNLNKEVAQLHKIAQKARVKRMNEKAKAQKKKHKEDLKIWRRAQEAENEKVRIRKERERFWPRSCYTIRITLDSSNFTPASSRRSSISSVTELAKPTPTEGDGKEVVDPTDSTCDLTLTYITSSAFWSPSYDLQLDTIKNTGILHYDAQLTNMTSETWSNCKIILSTSQQVFSGLRDTIPVLQPWRIALSRGQFRKEGNALESLEEQSHRQQHKQSQYQQQTQKPHHNLFGVSPITQPSSNPYPEQMLNALSESLFGGGGAPVPPPPPPPPSAAAPVVLAFGMNHSKPPPKPLRCTKKAAVSSGAPMAARAAKVNNTYDGAGEQVDLQEEDGDAQTILEPQPELAFQESGMEETGLTTTYDLPGAKSLAPSSTVSKQHIARVSFNGVVFSHTIVAKYKPVAYLKAKLRNASRLTLLKGTAGLTLDGSFMGRTTLPRCSAGDSFNLSLGVDPAIKVIYPKPDVRRSTSGLFSKEDSNVYVRTVTLTNTRAAAGKPVSLVVYDQAPVSEDEKLRVEILHPRGMSVNGGGVKTGAVHKERNNNTQGNDWGKAAAALKKGGEVQWDVSLNAGMSVKLSLEYEVALPTNDVVCQVT